MLGGALGEIEEITARAGRGDLVYLIMRHASGVSSSCAVSIDTPEAASQVSLTVWGPDGRRDLPERGDPSQALATAARELALAAAQPVPSHPCDVRLGLSVVRLLAEAERQLSR
jgi:hypothetical protein